MRDWSRAPAACKFRLSAIAREEWGFPTMSGKCVTASGQAFQLADPEASRSTARAVVSYANRLSPAFANMPSLAQLQAIADGQELESAKAQHNSVCTLLD